MLCTDSVLTVIRVILRIIAIVSAILLMLVILLQQKGSALGSAFGGTGNVYQTKRGIEKILFQLTIAFAVIFFGVSFIHLLFPTI